MSRSINETTTSNNMTRSDTASGNNVTRSGNDAASSTNMSRSMNDASSTGNGYEVIQSEDLQFMTPENQGIPSPSQKKKKSSVLNSLKKKLGYGSSKKNGDDNPPSVIRLTPSTSDEQGHGDGEPRPDDGEMPSSPRYTWGVIAAGQQVRKGIREAGEEISKDLRAPLSEFTESLQKMNQEWHTAAWVAAQVFLRCIFVWVWAMVANLFVSPHSSFIEKTMIAGAFVGMSALTLLNAATMAKAAAGPMKSDEELEEERKFQKKLVQNAHKRAKVRALELEAFELQAKDALRKAKAIERKAEKEAEKKKKTKRANHVGARDTHA